MPTTPRRKKGIADAIRERLAPMRAAADDTNVTRPDFTLADRVERQQRAGMDTAADDKKYGTRPTLEDDLVTANRNLARYPRRR